MSVMSALLPRRKRTGQPYTPADARRPSPAELIERQLDCTERYYREFAAQVGPARQPAFIPAQPAETRPQPALDEDDPVLVRVRDGLKAWNPDDRPVTAHPFSSPLPPDVASMLTAVRCPLTADLPAPPVMSRAAALRIDRGLPGFRAVARKLGWRGVLPLKDPAPPRYVDPADWAEAERLYNAEVDAALGGLTGAGL